MRRKNKAPLKPGPWRGPRPELRAVSSISINPDNPRSITSEKMERLKKSISEFRQMLDLRPLIINPAGVVLGGNMRLLACQELGIKEVPVVVAAGLSAEEEKRLIILDNASFGEWDWDRLANEWEADELLAWGLDLPVFSPEETEAPALSGADHSAFSQMTFILHTEQAEIVQAALEKAKAAGCSSALNSNSNGNALTEACRSFLNGKG